MTLYLFMYYFRMRRFNSLLFITWLTSNALNFTVLTIKAFCSPALCENVTFIYQKNSNITEKSLALQKSLNFHVFKAGKIRLSQSHHLKSEEDHHCLC